MHYSADRIVLHFCQHMDVIGHQAVCIKVKGLLGFLALEQFQKLEIVVVRLEYALSIIPTSNDVVEPTGYFNSRFSCHGAAGYYQA